MPYAILRFQKRKAGGVAACERHNERKKEAYKSNPDIDVGRSKDNYHLVNPPRYTYKKEINRMVAEAGCRTRKDSVMMVETLITASPEFMNSLPPEEQKAYFQTALDFISERVGKQNILSAVVHMDVKYSIVLIVYGVYRVREKRRIGTTYTNRKKNVYDVTWKRIRKILKSGIGSGSFFIP